MPGYSVRCSFRECTAILMVDGCALYTFHSPANGRVNHVTASSSQQHQLTLGEEDVFITGQSFHNYYCGIIVANMSIIKKYNTYIEDENE